MKYPILLSVALLSTIVSGAQTTNSRMEEGRMIRKIDGSEIESSQLNQYVEGLMKEAEVTGLAIAILNDNKVVYQEAFGYANIETKAPLQIDHIFYGASFSKAVFGYLVAQLAHEGVIDLDRPLQEYLPVPIPDVPVEKEFRRLGALRDDLRYEEITARMCLTHSTGLPNWRWIEPDEQLKIKFDPGTRYSYSGEGIMLLQWVVEYLTDEKLEDLAEERVFAPLGMDHTSYLWREQFAEHFCYGHSSEQKKLPKDIEEEDAAAAGSMETTLADYSKFLERILKLEAGHSPITRLLFTPGIRIRSKAQFGPQAQEQTDANDDIKLSYGLGWGLIETPYGPGAFKEGHGEGFQHYSIVFPEQDAGIVIMSNSDNAESIFKYLLEEAIGDRFTPWKWEGYVPYDWGDLD